MKVDAKFILDGSMPGGMRNDPVQMAMIALKLPAVGALNGHRYNHPAIMRWYVRRMGEEEFRQLVYLQWRENCIDGQPRHAGAFMDKLYLALNGKPGVKRHASGNNQQSANA